MCGIIGYVGKQQAAEILIRGLERLEYRGYDSAGVVVQNGRGLERRRTIGRIAALEAIVEEEPLIGTCGIGHTRWATHGAPNNANAHPHVDCGGQLAVVHNGIIENADALRAELERKGHEFASDTDSEVLAHLIEECWVPPLHLAVARALEVVEGAYGIAVMCATEPERLVCARRGSPLLIGLTDTATFAASDASAILPHTKSVIYLEDGEMAVLDSDGCEVLAIEDLRKIARVPTELEWSLQEAEKGGLPHFMLKEIREQPTSIRRAILGRLTAGSHEVHLGGLSDIGPELSHIRRVILTGCGTSYHAAMIGRMMLEKYARIPTEVEYASEWRYREPVLDRDTLLVGVSQSGETADTLASIGLARDRGITTLGIVNVVGSTVARGTDGGIYLHAGPEIGVASTKAFTSQVVALALLALFLGRQRGVDPEGARELVEALLALPDQVDSLLELELDIEKLAQHFADRPNFLYLGRGHSYPVALEGALKLKEISYIHAEGMSAAEMKHGPIALIDESMPVVVIAPRDSAYTKVLSNLQEVRARGGRLIGVTTGENGLAELTEACLVVPHTVDALLPVLTIVPLQLLAYYIGVARGCDVDKPRNLAKSVTVE